jgi:aryl-alcohol dehydrogenase-like predicted oxidoreductase
LKLAIGTAQFGMNYGAFNQSGQIDAVNVQAILKLARSANVTLFDTARAYGDSEKVLGELGVGDSFALVTKCPSLDGEPNASEAVTRYFHESLNRLKTKKIYGYLLHHSDDLLSNSGREIWSSLCKLREDGKVERIGISAYTPEDVFELLKFYPLSLVQLPINALTTWVHDDKYLEIFEQHKVELHSRSSFLQGFLLSNPDKLNGYLNKWKNVLISFRNRASELKLSPLQACFAALDAHTTISKIIVGVDNSLQLQEILDATKTRTVPLDAFEDIAIDDLGLIDPRLWKL